MSITKEQVADIAYTGTGAVLGMGVGGAMFQALGTFLLGILGAAGGWVFVEYLRPRIKPWFDRYFKPKA